MLFFNDIPNFAVEGCILNMYANDVIIYTSAVSTNELECKLQFYIYSISHWYDMNKLCINKKKSSVMVIGSKPQWLSLNLDDFAISLDVYKPSLAEQVRYVQSDSNCAVYSVWPNDALWYRGTGLPRILVMACCLMAPSPALLWWDFQELVWIKLWWICMGNQPSFSIQNFVKNNHNFAWASVS